MDVVRTSTLFPTGRSSSCIQCTSSPLSNVSDAVLLDEPYEMDPSKGLSIWKMEDRPYSGLEFAGLEAPDEAPNSKPASPGKAHMTDPDPNKFVSANVTPDAPSCVITQPVQTRLVLSVPEFVPSGFLGVRESQDLS